MATAQSSCSAFSRPNSTSGLFDFLPAERIFFLTSATFFPFFPHPRASPVVAGGRPLGLAPPLRPATVVVYSFMDFSPSSPPPPCPKGRFQDHHAVAVFAVRPSYFPLRSDSPKAFPNAGGIRGIPSGEPPMTIPLSLDPAFIQFRSC